MRFGLPVAKSHIRSSRFLKYVRRGAADGSETGLHPLRCFAPQQFQDHLNSLTHQREQFDEEL
jgi:hypothetical protein